DGWHVREHDRRFRDRLRDIPAPGSAGLTEAQRDLHGCTVRDQRSEVRRHFERWLSDIRPPNPAQPPILFQPSLAMATTTSMFFATTSQLTMGRAAEEILSAA